LRAWLIRGCRWRVGPGHGP